MQWINNFLSKSVVHEFRLPQINDSSIKLFVKRDDLIHSQISGNKLRKLKYNLKKAIDLKCKGIVTFGGAYSNHLLAAAAASKLSNLKAVGYVRGDELNEYSNQLLKECSQLGMKLIFLSRTEFLKIKYTSGINDFEGEKFLYVPEGGANLDGIEGCKEITENIDFDFVCLAQGTTTTSVGISLCLKEDQKALLVPVLKGFNSTLEMEMLLGNENLMNVIRNRILILDNYHFGGYAKINDELRIFVEEFNKINSFNVEPIYTGKAMFALNQYLNEYKMFLKNKKVLFVHTGGLHSF